MEEKQKKAGLVLLNEGLITEELLKKAEKQHKGTERRLFLLSTGASDAGIHQGVGFERNRARARPRNGTQRS